MKIAGFHSGHECTFCVLDNGIPVIHAEMERFARVKECPGDGLEFLFTHYKDYEQILYYTHEHTGWGGGIRVRYPKTFEEMIRLITKNQGKFLEPGHHQCHAANAFFSSNFDKALIVTIDGGGWDKVNISPDGYQYGNDYITAFTLWEGRGNKISLIKMFPDAQIYLGKLSPDEEINIGWVWNVCLAEIFGLSNGYPKGNQAGTVMAMAALGDWKRFFKDFYVHRFKHGFSTQKFKKKFEDLLANGNNDSLKFDVAAGLQKATETVVREILSPFVEKYDYRNLCLSGGVSLNSVMTNQMYQWFGAKIKNIYVSPVPYDAGLAIGGAQFVWHHALNNPRIPWKDNFSPYLGKSYDKTVIAESIEKYKGEIKTQKADDEFVLDLLDKQKIVAVFGKGAESGRRALGNRSILADPRNKEMKDLVNEKVKHRQWFRPFAPSILREYVRDWFQTDIDSPYMSFAAFLKEDCKEKVPAIVHFDGSARLQTVTESDNEWYYHFIRKWKEKTGIPMILNTSFNDREPIVETPEHAITCFLSTNIDYLYFFEEGILVNKNARNN